MSKFSKKLMVVIAAALLLIVGLVGCSSYKFTAVTGGQPDKNTESNNGMVVKQGDYIYFFNGKQTYENIKDVKDNKYGKVIKGAIYRAKHGDDGKYTDIKLIVPKIAMSKNYKAGLSIFGNYLYYASPSTGTDKTGAVQTSYTEYFRCKIDGTGTEKIATINGDTTEYKFTDKGMFYKEESTIKYIKYDDGGIKDTVTIAEDVTSSFFPSTENYSPTEGAVSDVVFYTKASEDKNAKHNILYMADKDGNSKEIINEKDADKKFNRTIKNVAVEGNEMVVYYEKTENVYGNAENKGLFGYKFDSNYTFDITKEKQFTNRSGLTVQYYTFDKGVFVIENGKLIINKFDNNGIIIADETVEYDTKSTSAPSIFDIREENGKVYLYHIVSNGLHKIEMNPEGGFIGNSQVIVEGNITTDWYSAEIIGNEIFYINSKYLNYMYVGDITTYNPANTNGIETYFVGERTKDDQKAYDKQIEEENKDK